MDTLKQLLHFLDAKTQIGKLLVQSYTVSSYRARPRIYAF